MKKIYALVLFLSGGLCAGQNLVPNGSFETYSACPGLAMERLPTGWINPIIYYTPDYFHECNDGYEHGVPSNQYGYQYARTGKAYCGIAVFYITPFYDYREFIEVRLTAPLLANVCYEFLMYVSLGEVFGRYTSDEWGVYFSNVAITNYSLTTGPLPFIPQITHNAGNYPDTAGWTPSTGSFVASGGEEYMIIGNFKNGINDTVLADSTVKWRECYIYIDDVSLYACEPTGLDNHDKQTTPGLFPNPFGSVLQVQIPGGGSAKLVMYDLNAELIVSRTVRNGEDLTMDTLADGIYYYMLSLENGDIISRKIIK